MIDINDLGKRKLTETQKVWKNGILGAIALFFVISGSYLIIIHTHWTVAIGLYLLFFANNIEHKMKQ